VERIGDCRPLFENTYPVPYPKYATAYAAAQMILRAPARVESVKIDDDDDDSERRCS